MAFLGRTVPVHSIGVFLLLFFFLQLTSIPVCAQNSRVREHITSLHEIKKDEDGDGTSDLNGDTVTVHGTANIASGQLHEVYLQVFIQNDSTGLSLFSKSFDTPVGRGDSIRARGVVQQYYGLQEIHVIEYEILRSGSRLPAPIPLEQAVAGPAPYEGLVVEGTGRVIGKGARFNGKFLSVAPTDTSSNSAMIYVSNFHSQYEQFDFESISVGDDVRINGVMTLYNPDYPEERTYKILLRTPDDIEIVGISQSTLIWLGGLAVLISLLAIGWIISLRMRVKSKTKQIWDSLKEKEILLKEIHHRVKNNLAIITGLIELQLENSANEETQKVLRDSQSRIKSMALVHDKLYRTSTLTDIGMRTYIEELVEALKSTFAGPDSDITLKFDIDEIHLDIDRAIPCGLLINELVVNSFKHAFNGELQGNGKLKIDLKEIDNQIVLTVADNGRGLPEDFEKKMESSLGMMLIETFTSQLDADIEVENRNGAHFTITFPAE